MAFKKLVVWQKSMKLVKQVYMLSDCLPSEERYGLTSQIQRAAVSIPANIAEGRKRRSRKDYIQFLRISNGSAAELETLLLIIIDVYQIPDSYVVECNSLLIEVQKMLSVMINKLETNS